MTPILRFVHMAVMGIREVCELHAGQGNTEVIQEKLLHSKTTQVPCLKGRIKRSHHPSVVICHEIKNVNHYLLALQQQVHCIKLQLG